MNDRFKFRVWAKPDEKTNTDGYYVNDADYIVMHPDGTAEITYCVDDGYAGQIVHFEQDEIIIEQCTGLKDKNGKLIYENDYVKIKDTVYKVFWNKTKISLDNILKKDIIDIDVTQNMEVVGNVHEARDSKKV